MPPVRYSSRFDSVELLQRGRTTELACRVYRAGALAVPTAGTFTLLDPSGDPVIDEAAVTISGGAATYSVPGATTAPLSLSAGWVMRWSLTMPDGVVHTFEAAGALCRAVPACPVTEATLWTRVPSLDPSRPGAISTRVEYSTTIDDCWTQLRELLLERGNRAELVVASAQLREPLLLLCLAQIFEDLAPQTRDTTYLDQARSYREQFGAKWAATSFSYDSDDNGVADVQKPARGPVWAM